MSIEEFEVKDILELKYGDSLPNRSRLDGEVPVFGSNGIVGYHNKSTTKGKTIIIGRKGSAGELNWSNVPCFPIDTTYFIDELKLDFSLEYIFFQLKRLKLSELNKSSAIPGLNREDVYKIKLKIETDKSKQIKIVDSVQSQLAHVEAIRQAALKQKKAAKVLQSAILWEMFPWQAGDSLPKGWRWEKPGKICKIYAGATPSRTNPDYWGGDIPWVKTGEINFNRISETEEFITEAGLNNSSARWIPKGAILIALYGQGVTRGKVAILDIEATSNQACCALVCPDSLLNIYLFYFLYSRYEDIRNLSSGSSQDNLSGGLIKDYSIPIPSTKAEQEKIAKLIEGKLQNFKKLGETFDNQLKAIEALPATILREAFDFAGNR